MKTKELWSFLWKFSIVCGLFISGLVWIIRQVQYAEEHKTKKVERIDNVKRVFMNTKWSYTICCQQDGELKLREINGGYEKAVRLILIPKEEPLRVEIDYVSYPYGDTVNSAARIYIHDESNLEAGSYKEGKAPRIQSHVVE